MVSPRSSRARSACSQHLLRGGRASEGLDEDHCVALHLAPEVRVLHRRCHPLAQPLHQLQGEGVHLRPVVQTVGQGRERVQRGSRRHRHGEDDGGRAEVVETRAGLHLERAPRGGRASAAPAPPPGAGWAAAGTPPRSGSAAAGGRPGRAATRRPRGRSRPPRRRAGSRGWRLSRGRAGPCARAVPHNGCKDTSADRSRGAVPARCGSPSSWLPVLALVSCPGSRPGTAVPDAGPDGTTEGLALRPVLAPGSIAFVHAADPGGSAACGRGAAPGRHGLGHRRDLTRNVAARRARGAGGVGTHSARCAPGGDELAGGVPGTGGEIGTVAPGARADLVSIDGDPRQDVSVLRHPPGVLLRGAWLERP